MTKQATRRELLQAGLGVGLGTAAWGSLGVSRLPAAEVGDGTLPLRSDIAPVVAMIEDTPRERLLETAAEWIAKGLSYQDLLAGLMLAGVKNIEPRPSVGFKFHSVLVVNSAHLASLASPAEHRWLPIFWALDHYKSGAARDVRERGDWTMAAVDEDKLPSASKARGEFVAAMDSWNEGQADRAVARLARSATAGEVYELFFRYAARDYRSIGHKAIFVANSWRTLQCIGWRHAEPIVRSLAYALLNHDGDNPAQRDDPADRPFRENSKRRQTIREGWRDGKLDRGATAELLAELRSCTPDEAAALAVEQLNRGVAPQSIWDAIHCRSGELLMQQVGILPLHAVTTSNAVRFLYEQTASDETRQMLLLQMASFLPMFRESAKSRGKLADLQLASLDEKTEPPKEVAAVFDTLGKDRLAAGRQVMQLLQSGGDARDLIRAARVLVYLKGRDAHDYKFSSAVLEDYYHVSPEWRSSYLAANVFNLHHSGEKDNQLVKRIRAALA